MIPQPILDALNDLKAKHDAYDTAVNDSQEAAHELATAQQEVAATIAAQDAAKSASDASLKGLEALIESTFRTA
jgi:hypothetical protein